MRRILLLLSAMCIFPLYDAFAINVEYSSPSHIQLKLSRWAGDLGSLRKAELYSGDAQQTWGPVGTWGGQGDVSGETYADLAVGSGVHYLRAIYYVYDDFEEKWTLEETQTVQLDRSFTSGALRPSLTGINTVTWTKAESPVLLYESVVVEDGILEIEPGVEVIFLDAQDQGAELRISGGALLDADRATFFNGVTSTFSGQVICESDASSGLQETLITNSVFDGVDLLATGSNLAFSALDFKHDGSVAEINGSKNALTESSLETIHLANASLSLVENNMVDDIIAGDNTAACISNTIRANTCDLISFPDTLNTSDGNIVENNVTGRIFIGGKYNRVSGNQVSCQVWEPAILLANEGNEVSGNQLTHCRDKGIEVSSSGNVIHRNDIVDCGDVGIYLRAFPPGAVENEITENEISDCLGEGIAIFGGQDTLVKDNAISRCGHPLIAGDAGISVKDFNPYVAQGNLVKGNSIDSCEVGVLSETSAPSNVAGADNFFLDNLIYHCELGFWAKSGYAVIANNAFVENDAYAIDDGSGGAWNTPLSDAEKNIVGGPFEGGNYYSGYSPADANADFIGDEPYIILDTTGALETSDLFPLLIPSQIEVSPTEYDFGGLLPGAYAAVVINIGNSAEALETLEVSGIQLTGSDMYALETSPAEQPCGGVNPVFDPGESCNVLVAFSPAALGQHDAALTILSDDPDEPEITIPLTGKGVALAGDADGDYALSLADPILILKVCAGLEPPELFVEGLANGSDFIPDDELQVNDALGILQTLALRR